MLIRLVRVLLRCRDGETIIDALHRRKVKIKKYMCHRSFSTNDFINALQECGVNYNDNLMVHASWREFYAYDGSPEEIVEALLQITGKNGNLVMPCFGRSKVYFDVDLDRSSAGVLSEIFRNRDDVIRSKCSHFSCAASGKDAYEIVSDHCNSSYGFDQQSPYYKFVHMPNSKIIMLGLGGHSVKLSLYHLPEMILKNDPFYSNLFKEKYEAEVVYRENGKMIRQIHTMMKRDDTIPNYFNILKIYKQGFVKKATLGGMDLVVLDAKPALDYILNEANNGRYMVRKHW